LIQHAVGVGGYLIFGFYYTPMDRLDLQTGRLTTLPVGDCRVTDMAADGTVSCFKGWGQTQGGTFLRLVAPTGATKDVPLPRPTFNLQGDAFFDPSGTVLTVAGATGVGNGMGNPHPLPEVFSTYLVRRDGSLAPFGPAGTRPALRRQSWLSSQQLVLWRPVGAYGGKAGLYVLDLNGQGNFIADSGYPIGVLSS
jgi:hypothetical protein